MLLATVFALAAAALHAGWNLRVKTSDDRFVALWGQFVMAGAVCAAGLVLTGLPARDAWPWLALSACIHVAYVVCLARGLRRRRLLPRLPAGSRRRRHGRRHRRGGVPRRPAHGAQLRRHRGDHRRARLLRAARHLVGLDPVGAAGGGPDRLLHARRRGGRPAHRGHRLRARAPSSATAITVSAWGLATGHLANLRRIAGQRRGGRTSPAGWPRPRPTGSCSTPCAGRRSATSPRCASRRWCSRPLAGWRLPRRGLRPRPPGVGDRRRHRPRPPRRRAR